MSSNPTRSKRYTEEFKAKDNKSPQTKELEALINENKRLKMVNDILKQAALILAQK